MSLNYQTMNLTPSLKVRAAAELERRRRERLANPDAFKAWVTAVNPKYQWYPHVTQLAGVLQRVADGDLKRLMVFMPPRHGKSELVSRLFSAYYLYRYPGRWVGINSYAAELAYTFSRAARENFTRGNGRISDTSSAVKHWETAVGGGLWAAGVGGPITGKGFHCGVIDDPIKNAEEAASDRIRAKHKEWYDSTFYTRSEPGASIIVIQTRWHEDDLSGYLLAQETAVDNAPEAWHIVHFEALKEKHTPPYPDTCSLEKDTRDPGQALAPDRYTAERLAEIQERIGAYFFGALYQQTPKPREGNMFKRSWFEIVPHLPHPKQAKFVRYWDKAGTKDAGAYTAGLLLAKVDGAYFILDLIMGQWAADEREAIIKQTAVSDRERWGHVRIGVEQEPGSGGKESAENTIKMLAGHPAFADRPVGDKVLRAEPVVAQAAVGNLKLLAGSWNGRFIDIATAFPMGAIKDPVDALSGAFATLSGGGASLPKEQPTKDNPYKHLRIDSGRKGSRWKV